jgi:hypothetical protein
MKLNLGTDYRATARAASLLPFVHCVTVGKLPNLSVPQFPTNIMRIIIIMTLYLLGRLNESIIPSVWNRVWLMLSGNSACYCHSDRASLSQNAWAQNACGISYYAYT